MHFSNTVLGISLSPSTLSDFMTFLSSSPNSPGLSFTEFRDFLLLLPRKASTTEIYRYYQIRRIVGDDERGASRANMEGACVSPHLHNFNLIQVSTGDVSVVAELQPPKHKTKSAVSHPSDSTEPSASSSTQPSSSQHTHGVGSTNHARHHAHHPRQLDPDEEAVGDNDYFDEDGDDEEDYFEEEPAHWLGGSNALKYLLAGGIAGAVSRTATAPFDRLKVYLMTRPPDLRPLQPMVAAVESASLNNPMQAMQTGQQGARLLFGAVARLYAEGGIMAFWVGNGLNIVKIFPVREAVYLTWLTLDSSSFDCLCLIWFRKVRSSSCPTSRQCVPPAPLDNTQFLMLTSAISQSETLLCQVHRYGRGSS